MSVNGAGGSEPLRRGFLGPKEHLDWLNDTGKTLFYPIQYKNLLKDKLRNKKINIVLKLLQLV